jgi:hypothetical protein
MFSGVENLRENGIMRLYLEIARTAAHERQQEKADHTESYNQDDEDPEYSGNFLCSF